MPHHRFRGQNMAVTSFISDLENQPVFTGTVDLSSNLSV
ncbi:hypothetical protein SynA1560_02227 [Synechococcus sp. A15-60]|nr:hypothetical protein SynA1560_02227 [Synechococcus sp. A15-60]